MESLRELHFDDLNAAAREAESLLSSGYSRNGQWSLGQICRHSILVQDPSIDGYPNWMSLFAFLRPLMRRWLLPKLLSGDSPRGIRTTSSFMPLAETDDVAEVVKFRGSVERLLQHDGDYAPHPAFGRMTREQILEIHCSHTAHHLRFLVPRKRFRISRVHCEINGVLCSYEAVTQRIFCGSRHFARTIVARKRLSLRTHKSQSTDERVKSFLMLSKIQSSRLEQIHEGTFFASLGFQCEPSNLNDAPAYPRLM